MATGTTLVRGIQTGPGLRDGLHVVVVGPDMVEICSVPLPSELLLGRSRQCEVVLTDGRASGRHARLQATIDGCLKIEDLGGKNGTLLNTALLAAHRPVVLVPGDIVGIGVCQIVPRVGAHYPSRGRLWSYDDLEQALDDALATAREKREGIALVHWETARSVAWPRVVAELAAAVPPPNALIAYAPRHHLAMLVGLSESDVEQVAEAGREALQGLSQESVRHGVAFSPRDGAKAAALIERAFDALRRRSGPPVTHDWNGAASSSKMVSVLNLAERAARSNITVLITGETGVGKEVTARRIHETSVRQRAPMLTVNCGALAETLVDSELFGYERGAFTGATTSRRGLLESAEGGTVFLDEIGETTQATQTKLLRALESREIIPVGGRAARTIDVRFVAATNKDLEYECRQGRFREDLYFRLAGIVIYVPPLRERREEILPFATTFIAAAVAPTGRSPPRLTQAALEMMMRYTWPGNIRELRNAMEHAVVLCDGDEIGAEHLPQTLRRGSVGESLLRGGRITVDESTVRVLGARRSAVDEGGIRTDERRRQVTEALSRNGWNQGKAALELGVSRKTLMVWMDKLGIPRPQKATRVS